MLSDAKAAGAHALDARSLTFGSGGSEQSAWWLTVGHQATEVTAASSLECDLNYAE